VALLLALLLLLVVAPSATASELVVTLAPGAERGEAEWIAATAGGRVVDAIPQLGAFLIDVPRPFAPRLASASRVRSIEPNPTDTLSGSPPFRGPDWHLRATSVTTAWAQTRGDPSVVVAVVDSGIDPDRAELTGRLILGRDTANEDDDPTDSDGHGTFVAGVVAADSDFASGVCPRCTVMAVKAVADRSAEATKFDSAEAIVWAVDHGADIVNLSIGGSERATVQEDAVRYAVARGVLVVSAAGNEDSNVEQYPAAYDGVVAVGGSNQQDATWSGSSFGSWVDLAAPADAIISFALEGAYEKRRGTSFATPIVAGIAALILAARPETSGDGLAAALAAGTVPLANAEHPFARGRIDAVLALAKAAVPGAPTLSIDRFALSPQASFVRGYPAARAGERFAVAARVRRDDTGELIRDGEVRCDARIGTRTLRVAGAGLVGSVARCLVAVPSWAGERWIEGTLTVLRNGYEASQPFRVKAKKLLRAA
jgi:subtilisin family serine protease